MGVLKRYRRGKVDRSTKIVHNMHKHRRLVQYGNYGTLFFKI